MMGTSNVNEPIGEDDEMFRCDACKRTLALVRKPEYPGGYAWPYYYCDNPECKKYGKEQ